MNDFDHRPGVKEINLVYRYLKLEGVKQSNKDKIIESIDSVIGVETVSYDEQHSLLTLAYDATQCELDDFESLLQHFGADIDSGLWTKLKEGYYKFIDQNVKDNAEHDPLSSNSLPKALPGSRKH